MADAHEPYTGSGDVCFAGYTFDAHKASFVCPHVMAGAPVMAFFHEQDGDVQFLCDAPSHDDTEPRLVCLHHVVDAHPELLSLPTVDFGMVAWREGVGEPWQVEPRETAEE